jgi:hypothetical protein
MGDNASINNILYRLIQKEFKATLGLNWEADY